MSSYVFILSPPYCGSTLLYQLMATSPAVSCLPKEGQFIDGASDILRTNAWNPDHPMPWDIISPIWHQYWDESKPYLVEKSPPNIVRANAIQAFFQPAQFIVLVRDPYAHAEGLLRRRKGWDESRAAQFVITCLKQQIENMQRLESTFSVTYENLCNHPTKVSEELLNFLPKLKRLDTSQEFNLHSVDGQRAQTITNLNAKKLRRLSRKSIGLINQYFEQHLEVLGFWGYSHYEPGRFHDILHIVERRFI